MPENRTTKVAHASNTLTQKQKGKIETYDYNGGFAHAVNLKPEHELTITVRIIFKIHAVLPVPFLLFDIAPRPSAFITIPSASPVDFVLKEERNLAVPPRWVGALSLANF